MTDDSPLSVVDGTWRVGGPLTVDTLAAIIDASAKLTLPDQGTVDFSGVGVVDSAAVAAVIAWKRRALNEQKPLRYVNLPRALSTLADLYGVEDLIGS